LTASVSPIMNELHHGPLISPLRHEQREKEDVLEDDSELEDRNSNNVHHSSLVKLGLIRMRMPMRMHLLIVTPTVVRRIASGLKVTDDPLVDMRSMGTVPRRVARLRMRVGRFESASFEVRVTHAVGDEFDNEDGEDAHHRYCGCPVVLRPSESLRQYTLI
jgi:hypothetical protein